MSASDYYPAMTQSQWDSAPFNEVRIPEEDFEVNAVFTLEKVVDVTTADYTPEYDEEDGRTTYDTTNTDWENAYDESGHYSILEMLDKLKEYVEHDLSMTGENTSKGRMLKQLLEDCQGWDCTYKEFNGQ